MTDATQLVVPSRAYTWVAPVGTAAPVDEVTAPAAEWINVGLTTPDSLEFATDPQFESVNSHQSDYPVRRMQTSEAGTISVDLQQWNKDNITFAFGGGTVTAVTAGHFKFVPPALGARVERSVLIDWIDGSKHYRLVIPRCIQVEGVTTALQKGQEARLPLRLAILGGDSVDPWYLLTDDPAMDPA
jgi:hypothetical protein